MTITRALALLAVCACLGQPATASVPSSRLDAAGLDQAFDGAEKIDLRTSTVSSVVKLREVVGIPPPETTVLVKTFKRDSIPAALAPVFAKPGIAGVTIGGRYVAIIHTDLRKEHEDVLRHELVHAYITLASPQPLPFWFQEGSAVHFSTDKGRKFYGQPSEDNPGVMVGRSVELTDTYKQKLNNFHYLIDKVGKDRFYEWYRNAVETGEVDARPLLGLPTDEEAEPASFTRPFPVWLGVVIGLVIVAVAVAGYYSMKTGGE